MSSLFVDRRDAYLEYDDGALVFREGDAHGERLATVPLAPIRRVFLRGSLTLQASLLGQLGTRGIGVVVLTGRVGRPSLLLGRPHHDARRRVEQVRRSLDTAFCVDFSRQLVQRKLQAQHGILAALKGRHPQARYALVHAQQLLEQALPRLTDIDSLDNLRGLEGSAAHVYFSALAAVLPAGLGFEHRNRQPPRDPFNAVLSLTYTLLQAEMAMALHGAGFDPYVGYYHQLSWGRESLACDLIEPQRPLADQLCLQLIADQTLTTDHFSTSAAGCLLGKAGRAHYYPAYEALAQPLRSGIKQSVAELARYIDPTDDLQPEAEPEADVDTLY